MKIQLMHPNATVPKRSTTDAAAFDITMPEGGSLNFLGDPADNTLLHPLGFALEIPTGVAVLLLPRSGVGVRDGLYLRNTTGLIDPDYRGQVMAAFGIHNNEYFQWFAGASLLQMLILRTESPVFKVVKQLTNTSRGTGGFGHTDNIGEKHAA